MKGISRPLFRGTICASLAITLAHAQFSRAQDSKYAANKTTPDKSAAHELSQLWAHLAEEDAEKAYRAIGKMASVPGVIPFLKTRLQPVPDNSKHIEKLLRDLDSSVFAVREKAVGELQSTMSEAVENLLKQALANKPALETRRRLEQLLESIQRSAESPGRVRQVRALEVLEMAGTAEALGLLKTLADGNPAASWTQQASAAHVRLTARSRPAPGVKAAKADQFGDPLPAGILMRLGTTRMQNANYAALTPDGKTLYTIADQTLAAWDTKTGRAMPGYPQLKDWRQTRAVAISPSGEFLAVAHDTAYSFDICELPSGKLLHRHQGSGDHIDCNYLVAFTADSKTFVTINQKNTQRWDVTTGKKLSEDGSHGGNLHLAVVAPNGNWLATARGHTLDVWDGETGKLRHEFKNQGYIQTACFNHDGTRLVAGSEWGCVIRVWDTQSGELLRVFNREAISVKGDPTTSLAFSPDGKTLAFTDSVSNGSSEIRIKLCNLDNKNSLPRVVEPPQGIGWLHEYSQDGKTLVYRIGNSFRLLDADTGKDRHAWDCRGGVTAVAYAHDGLHIAAGTQDGVLSLYDAASARLVRRLGAHQGNVSSISFSPDGKLIVSCGGYKEPAILWDAATGARKAELDTNRKTPLAGGRFAAFSPDSRFVTVAGYSINHASFATATGKLDREFPVQNDSTWSMAFSSDGRYIASGVNNVFIHDRVTQKTSRMLDVNGQCVASAFSNDSRTFAAVNSRGEVFLWEVLTGRARARFEFPKTYLWSGQLAFSPDNRLLAAVGHTLQSPPLQIWEVTTRKQRGPFPGHIGNITAVAFSPDGSRLATASNDGTVLIREAPR